MKMDYLYQKVFSDEAMAVEVGREDCWSITLLMNESFRRKKFHEFFIGVVR